MESNEVCQVELEKIYFIAILHEMYCKEGKFTFILLNTDLIWV